MDVFLLFCFSLFPYEIGMNVEKSDSQHFLSSLEGNRWNQNKHRRNEEVGQVVGEQFSAVEEGNGEFHKQTNFQKKIGENTTEGSMGG